MKAPCAEDVIVGGERALLVDDSPAVAQLCASMLAELGFDVRALADPAAALEVACAEDFELVVSDIVMPGPMNGVALACAIRKRKPEMPILLMTGYNPIGDHKPMDDFTVILKPFQLAALSQAVARVIIERRKLLAAPK
jgi:DNA-binding NtrC family response regulator